MGQPFYISVALEAVIAKEGVTIGGRPHLAMVEARQLEVVLAKLMACLRMPQGSEHDRLRGGGHRGVRFAVCTVRKRPEEAPPQGWQWGGRRYDTRAEYEAAVDAWNARKTRLLAAVMAERGEDET